MRIEFDHISENEPTIKERLERLPRQQALHLLGVMLDIVANQEDLDAEMEKRLLLLKKRMQITDRTTAAAGITFDNVGQLESLDDRMRSMFYRLLEEIEQKPTVSENTTLVMPDTENEEQIM